MAEAQVLNGVNVAAVNELAKNVESDPKLGECRFHIKNTWSTCGQNQSKVSSFYAAKQEIPREDPFTLTADEPAILAGHDTGANPVEHLLHALAGCLTTTLIYHAALRGIKVEAIESELEGDLDIRGFLGISDTVRKGFQNIRVNFKVRTDAGNIEKLKALSTLSPVFDMTSHGTNVQ
ncbi:MAG: OsmC family protein, partial [Nitrospirota bacterium]